MGGGGGGVVFCFAYLLRNGNVVVPINDEALYSYSYVVCSIDICR